MKIIFFQNLFFALWAVKGVKIQNFNPFCRGEYLVSAAIIDDFEVT